MTGDTDSERPMPDRLTVRSTTPLLGRVSAALSTLRLSDVVSGTLALVAVVLVGSRLLGGRLTALAAVGGAGIALGLVALASDRTRALLFSGAALTPAATLLVVALGVGIGFGAGTATPVGYLAGLVVLLVATGAFAAVFAVVPDDPAALLATAYVRFLGLLPPLAAVALFAALVAVGDTTLLTRLAVDSPEPLLVVARLLLAPTGSLALLTALLYVVLSLYTLRLAVTSLPFAKLVPPRQRPSISVRVHELAVALGRATAGTAAAAAALYLVAVLSGTATPGAIAGVLGSPVGDAVAALLTAVWPRVVLVVWLGIVGAVLVAEQVRRRVRRHSDADFRRYALAIAGIFAVTAVGGLALDATVSADTLRSQALAAGYPPAAALLGGGVLPAVAIGTVAALVVVAALLTLLFVLVASPVVPEPALAPAVGAGSLFALALALALLGGSSALAIAAVVLSMLVWDTGEYATGLRTELPDTAPTARGELVHIGASIAVAVLAVTVALGLEAVVESGLLVPTTSTTTAVAGSLAAVTAVALLSTLRG